MCVLFRAHFAALSNKALAFSACRQTFPALPLPRSTAAAFEIRGKLAGSRTEMTDFRFDAGRLRLINERSIEL